MAGTVIREWATGAHSVMPFTNIRGWSGPPVEIRDWRRFVGSTEQRAGNARGRERRPYTDCSVFKQHFSVTYILFALQNFNAF